jgi:hypothetical protein
MGVSAHGHFVVACAGLIAAHIAPTYATASPPAIVFDAARQTPAGGNPVGLVAADLDGDGRPDLAVSNASTHDVSILLGRADGSFFAVTPAIVSPHPLTIAAADFNGDGRMDLVAGDLSGKSVVVAFGSGGGLFAAGATYDAGMAPSFVATGDFNGDHRPDIMVGGPYFGIAVLLNLGSGVMGTRVIVYADQPPPPFGSHSAYRVGDLDGDGLGDIAFAGFLSVDFELEGEGFDLFRSLGDGSFSSSHINGAYFPYDLELVDWDRDGRLDVALLGDATYIMVNRNLGGAAFSPPGPVLWVPDSSTALAAADYNGDGVPDMAVGQEGASLMVLKAGLGDGTLGPDTPLTLPDTFRQMVVADFNGDTLPDLALVESSLNAIAVYLNRSAGPPPPPPAGEAAADPNLIQVTTYDPATGVLGFTYGPACQATDHTVVFGDLTSAIRGSYSGMVCGIGTSGAASFNPGSGSVFFLVVGNNGTTEGSYGQNSLGVERPEATGLGVCDYPQDLLGLCPNSP